MKDSTTDRELLELAAKAAGINASWPSEEDADYDASREGMFLNGKRSACNSKYWNPITDDGDAFRLAVACDLVVDTSRPSAGEPFKPHHFAQEGFIDRGAAAIRAAAPQGEPP
jgi:hypothetical protein